MGVFLGQITTKNLSLRSWEITKKSFRRKLLKIFHFFTLWIWLFGIFDKRPQGCYEVKYSMGLLQGPRLMARTTKSPIRRNHWVPLGCRGHLGSVKLKISAADMLAIEKAVSKGDYFQCRPESSSSLHNMSTPQAVQCTIVGRRTKKKLYSEYSHHKRRPWTFGWSLWCTNCPVNFSFFWSTKKRRPDKNFLVSLWIFLASLWLFCSPSNRETDQKKFRDWPKFFCSVS